MGKFRYAIAARAIALAVKRSLSEHNKKSKIKLQQQELMEMEHDEFLQVIRSPFHFATCDAVLRGCKIVDISKPLQRRRLSKKVRSPLGPSARGSAAGGGGESCTAVQNISGYGKVLSLRPFGAPLPPLAQAPPPPYRGSLSRRGRLFDSLSRGSGRAYSDRGCKV